MSDDQLVEDPYRSEGHKRPKIFKSHGILVMLGEVVSVVEYSRTINIGLKTGERVSATWTGPEGSSIVTKIFKGLTEALEEYHK